MSTLLYIMMSFGKIGLIALGGGNAMLKLIEYEAVTHHHWLEQNEFVQMVGSTFLFPGLTGVKLAALIGYKAGGLLGLILAVISLNLPGLLLAFLGYQWLSYHTGPVAQKLMIAVQYGALALLAAATFSIAESILQIYYSATLILTTIAFFIALVIWKWSPFWGFLGFIGVCFLLI